MRLDGRNLSIDDATFCDVQHSVRFEKSVESIQYRRTTTKYTMVSKVERKVVPLKKPPHSPAEVDVVDE